MRHIEMLALIIYFAPQIQMKVDFPSFFSFPDQWLGGADKFVENHYMGLLYVIEKLFFFFLFLCWSIRMGDFANHLLQNVER